MWSHSPSAAAPKLAITVHPDVYDRVLEAAEADGSRVSARMTAAARRALAVRDGLAAVAEWGSEHGPLTEAELAAARRRATAGAVVDVGREAAEIVTGDRHDISRLLDAMGSTATVTDV